MSSLKNISIFFAHQFSSSLENSTDIRQAVQKAIQFCEDAWNAATPAHTVKFSYRSIPSIPSGAELFQEVIRQIDDSDICLFSLTDHNMNVLFELGFAHGRNKSNIWILNDSISELELPTDFRSRFTLRYKNKEDLANKLEGELTSRIRGILSLETPDYYFSEFWNLNHSRTSTIIAPTLPEEDRPPYAMQSNPNFLKYTSFADIDATIHIIKFLNRVFSIETREFVSSNFHEEMTDPTFLLGGPLWNDRARRFYNFRETTGTFEKIPVYFAKSHGDEFDSIVFEGKNHDRVKIDDSTYTEYALFARIIEPDNGLPVFVASGNTTHGTLMGLKAFDESEFGKRNCEAIYREVGKSDQFFVLFKITVRDGVPSTPDFTSARVSYICRKIEQIG